LIFCYTEISKNKKGAKKMSTIAIFRKAKMGQKSSINHVVNSQSLDNHGTQKNPNYLQENKLYIFDEAKNDFTFTKYQRDGESQELNNLLNAKIKELYKLARADYQQNKELEKDQIFKKCREQGTKPPKIRTVLQSKDLVKEVVIALGGDKSIDKAKFEKNAVEFAKKFVDKKQLENKNIISISVHYDESAPHLHLHYCDYSFKKHTTATSLESVQCKDKTKEEKTALVKSAREKFGEFQDMAASTFDMARGQKGSREKNKEKALFLKEQLHMMEQVKQQKLAELSRLNSEIRANKEIENTITTNKEIIKEQEQQINKNDAVIKDKVLKTDDNKVRVEMGAIGLRRVFNSLANKEGLTLQEWAKKHGPTYSPQNGFKALEDAFKQLPPMQNMQISRDKELTR
jgi:hypothetical protein